MNDMLTVVVHLVELLLGIGFYYGVVKTKLETLVEIKNTINELNEKANRSMITSSQQIIINQNMKDQLDIITDRLDMHDEALKAIEIALAKGQHHHQQHGDKVIT